MCDINKIDNDNSYLKLLRTTFKAVAGLIQPVDLKFDTCEPEQQKLLMGAVFFVFI